MQEERALLIGYTDRFFMFMSSSYSTQISFLISVANSSDRLQELKLVEKEVFINVCIYERLYDKMRLTFSIIICFCPIQV